MSCITGVGLDIISDCNTSIKGGNEVKAWIGNRLEMSPTYDGTNPSKITALAVDVTKKLYTITGVKKLLNSGYDRVIKDNRPDSFTHLFEFQGFEFDAANVEGMDSLDDVVIIVESKDKTSDGDSVFRVFGMEYGLFPSSDTMRANDNDGVRAMALTSQEGQEEKYSNYTLLITDYATTLAALVALEAVQS